MTITVWCIAEGLFNRQRITIDTNLVETDAENDQYICTEDHALKQPRRNYSELNRGPTGTDISRTAANAQNPREMVRVQFASRPYAPAVYCLKQNALLSVVRCAEHQLLAYETKCTFAVIAPMSAVRNRESGQGKWFLKATEDLTPLKLGGWFEVLGAKCGVGVAATGVVRAPSCKLYSRAVSRVACRVCQKQPIRQAAPEDAFVTYTSAREHRGAFNVTTKRVTPREHSTFQHQTGQCQLP